VTSSAPVVVFLAFLPLSLLAPAPCLRAEEEPGVEPVLLRVEKEGKGLAEKYPFERGIEEDPRVLFADGFEADDLSERWTQVKSRPGTVSYAGDVENVHSGRRALRIDHRPGRDTGGHLYRMLEKGREKLHVRFYVKFPEDHGYVHHFFHLVGYRPSTPWPQGGAGERPAGDERFSTGLDLFGDRGRTPPPGRWGFYSYWCEMKAAPDGRYWGNEPEGGKRIPAARGRWICAEVMLKVNSVGEADGEQAFWIDGRCAGRWGGYRWRTHGDLKISAVWLLYYITDAALRRSRGEPKAEHVLFDDVVVATDYIGPMEKPRSSR
jgi:hypothetical protein